MALAVAHESKRRHWLSRFGPGPRSNRDTVSEPDIGTARHGLDCLNQLIIALHSLPLLILPNNSCNDNSCKQAPFRSKIEPSFASKSRQDIRRVFSFSEGRLHTNILVPLVDVQIPLCSHTNQSQVATTTTTSTTTTTCYLSCETPTNSDRHQFGLLLVAGASNCRSQRPMHELKALHSERRSHSSRLNM